MIPDIPRVLSAFVEWGACMVFLYPSIKKNLNRMTVVKILAFLAIFNVYHLLVQHLPIEFWVAGMVGAGMLMFLMIHLIGNNPLYDSIYDAAFAFITAELVQSFEWQFHTYFFPSSVMQETLLSISIAMVSYVVLLIGIWFITNKVLFIDRIDFRIKPKQLWGTVLIVMGAFLMSNISFIPINTPFSGRMAQEIFYIRTLVDFSALMIIFTLKEQFYQTQIAYDLKAIQDILYRQYEQYKMSKESVEMINRKYHDLKHQLELIKLTTNDEEKQSYIHQLESEIMLHAPQHHTGNHVVDTLLNSKAIVCRNENINFTAVVDGKLLDSIEVMDICTLFGNALDNAIESVSTLEESEKRLIRVAVYKQNRFIMLKFENYYENELVYSDDDLVTTKSNKLYHGYGIKSLKYTAEKYNGTLTIHTDNHWFTLCILIPFNG